MQTNSQKLLTNTFVIAAGVLKSNNSTLSVINVSFGPSSKSRIRYQGRVGDKVQLLDKIKPSGEALNWYKIRYDDSIDDTGWVREDVVEVVPIDNTNSSDPNTLVFFVTNTKTVRIFQDQGLAYINVYDKASKVTELRRFPVAKLPQLDVKSQLKSYFTVKDGYAYYVRFIPFSEVELIISYSADGVILLREKALSASGREYQNNF